MVTAALHRLLLAVLHRVFGPENLATWKRLWQAGRFDATALDDYWRRWAARLKMRPLDWLLIAIYACAD